VVNDAHLRARAFLGEIERLDESATFTSPATPWLIDGWRPHALSRPPALGQDNAYVFKTVLGLAAAAYDALIRDHVIY